MEPREKNAAGREREMPTHKWCFGKDVSGKWTNTIAHHK